MAVWEGISMEYFLCDMAIHDILPKSQAVHFNWYVSLCVENKKYKKYIFHMCNWKALKEHLQANIEFAEIKWSRLWIELKLCIHWS